MRQLKRPFLRDRGGNFATVTALVSPLLIVVAAFGVDTGSFFLERREAQSATDLAAMIAARAPDDAEHVARTVFADNGWPQAADEGEDAVKVATKAGVYTADPTIEPAKRFVAGQEPANAVQVVFEKKATRFFSGSLIEAPTIRTSAVASIEPRATFSIGSRLAALDGGIANQLLSSLLGTSISLSAMDYDALLKTEIDVLAFIEQAGIQADLNAVNYRDVLDAEISARHALRGLAATPGVDLTARNALQAVANAVPAAQTIRLGDMIDLGNGVNARIEGVEAGLDLEANAMAMLRAFAGLANGENQIAVDLGASIPGIANATVTLAVGERPRFSVHGPVGTSARTAQTRLRIDLAIGTSNPILTARINVPVFIDIAYGEGRIDSISCLTGRQESARVGIAARPGIVEAHIAGMDIRQMQDFSRLPTLSRAHLVDVRALGIPIARIEARAEARATNIDEDQLSFT